MTPGPRGSVTVDVSIIKAYKTGRLNVAKSGPVMSVTLTSTCKRCPGLTKGKVPPPVSQPRSVCGGPILTHFFAGLNYVLMGNVDAQGNGLLTPSSFTLLYKPVHAKALANLSRSAC